MLTKMDSGNIAPENEEKKVITELVTAFYDCLLASSMAASARLSAFSPS